MTVWNKKEQHADYETLVGEGMLLPAMFKRVFYTNRDDQTRMILAFAKRRGKDGEPVSLGHFVFGPILKPRRNSPMKVTVSISVDGCIHVSAKDPQTGQEISSQLQ